ARMFPTTRARLPTGPTPGFAATAPARSSPISEREQCDLASGPYPFASGVGVRLRSSASTRDDGSRAPVGIRPRRIASRNWSTSCVVSVSDRDRSSSSGICIGFLVLRATGGTSPAEDDTDYAAVRQRRIEGASFGVTGKLAPSRRNQLAPGTGRAAADCLLGERELRKPASLRPFLAQSRRGSGAPSARQHPPSGAIWFSGNGSPLQPARRATVAASQHGPEERAMRFKHGSPLCAAVAALLVMSAATGTARAEDTIKVGILHSLSGTMAISETILKDLMLMQIAELNAHGGLLGKKIEPVVVDPASNWPLFAEKARELISKDKVAAVFGCWTSVSRKSALPVFEELNRLLFYPLEYEGEEASYNVFYGGSVPSNKAVPSIEYLMSDEGGAVKRWGSRAP